MMNYIRSDIGRILRKKSIYVLSAIFIVLYIIFTLMRSSKFTQESISGEANLVFTFLAIILGSIMFSTIYNDDITAKTLPQVIGFGRRKAEIVFSKIIVNIIFTIVMCTVAIIILYILFMTFGLKIDSETFGAMLLEAASCLLLIVGYASISGVFVYATQKVAVPLVMFVLLSTGFIGQMLDLLLNWEIIKGLFGDLSRFLLEPTVSKMVHAEDASDLMFGIIAYIIYMGVFSAISIMAFRKKELEF